jgi:hypothetical protein
MNFQASITYVHDSINLCRIIDLNRRTNHLAFEFVGQHTWATFLNQMGSSSFVTRPVFCKNGGICEKTM